MLSSARGSEPFITVSTNRSGKHRLILDLKYVNLSLFKFTVKYEDLFTLKYYLENSYCMVKFDMKSGYHHIKIFDEHQNYLGFSWPVGGIDRFFKFRVLPFGLSSACNIFTKIFRPLVAPGGEFRHKNNSLSRRRNNCS